jgi:hypothetical protein
MPLVLLPGMPYIMFHQASVIVARPASALIAISRPSPTLWPGAGGRHHGNPQEAVDESGVPFEASVGQNDVEPGSDGLPRAVPHDDGASHAVAFLYQLDGSGAGVQLDALCDAGFESKADQARSQPNR